MSDSKDRKLGMDRTITRRDFLNGVAVGTGGAVAGSLLPDVAWEALGPSGTAAAGQNRAGYYPPGLTGLRGSHPGSFEAAHAVRDTKSWQDAATDTGESYDLVIVGGG